MRMMTIALLIAMALLVLPSICHADNILAEANEAVVKNCETSGLIGNTGFALGLYWPLAEISKMGLTIGPMGAIGNEVIIGGIGTQLPVSITVLGIELPVNFCFAGGAYDWVAEELGIVGGVGRTFGVEF